MPGLTGFFSNKIEPKSVCETVKKMQDMVTHKPCYRCDPVYSNKGLSATRSHIDIMNTEPQPATGGDTVHVWFDGEIHNYCEFTAANGNGDKKNDASTFLYLYQSNWDFSFLRNIDGGFAAVIYDESDQKIHLITDRHCRQHLNWFLYEKGFAWSTEIKAFSAIPDVSLKFDSRAVEEFVNMGHLMGERTWFLNVYLMPAATVLTYDIAKHCVNKKRYWWWDELVPFSGKLDIRELADYIGDLFIDSVNKLSNLTPHRVGISLSGGRDSRAIFAAMSENGETIPVVTFGQRNSLDVEMATRIARKKKTRHYLHLLNKKNWFQDRLKGVWWTDGQSSFLHMHGVAAQNEHALAYSVAFNGLAGEAIAGKIRQFEMSGVKEHIRRVDKYGMFSETFKERYRLYIESMGCPEVYALNHRFRNFGLIGIKQGEAVGVRTRFPFLDNRLMEFVYKIPPEYKEEVKLYDTMLLIKFPEFFEDLSWRHLDMVVGNSHKRHYHVNMSMQFLNRIMAKAGLARRITPAMANYSAWMRSEPERSFFRDIIYSKDAIYPEYIDRDKVVYIFEEHMNGKNNEQVLSRYLTFEIWLQQFNNRMFLN